MTPKQIKIAREAMGLQGVPTCTLDDECPYALALISVGSYEEWVWDIADTSPAGLALGGVLFNALGPNKQLTHNIDGTINIAYFHPESTRLQRANGTTITEACCVVANHYGCWPGGIKND